MTARLGDSARVIFFPFFLDYFFFHFCFFAFAFFFVFFLFVLADFALVVVAVSRQWCLWGVRAGAMGK
jgi:hypothetical protein